MKGIGPSRVPCVGDRGAARPPRRGVWGELVRDVQPHRLSETVSKATSSIIYLDLKLHAYQGFESWSIVNHRMPTTYIRCKHFERFVPASVFSL